MQSLHVVDVWLKYMLGFLCQTNLQNPRSHCIVVDAFPRHADLCTFPSS
ncbi:MAG: hypothetical protein F6J86_04740 [Symploca sp. SIO1B1]|nr:hypothetical protein [Symploca sp. SIO1B1]